MKTRFRLTTNYITGILIILTLAFLFFSYFYFYIPAQESSLQKRAYRVLDRYSKNMLDKYGYYKGHLNSYEWVYVVKFIRYDYTNKYYQSDLELQEKFNPIYGAINSITLNDIELDTISGIINSRGFYLDSINNRYYLPFTSTTDPKIISGIFKENDINIYQFAPNYISSMEKIRNHRVSMETFFKAIKFDNLFDDIVFYSEKSNLLVKTTDKSINNFSFSQDIMDTLFKDPGSKVVEIEFMGEKQQVVILPFKFLDEDVFLAGFINDKNYDIKTRAISNHILIIISSIILLLLICLPVIKIFIINKQERLHNIDANGATLSLIVGLSLFVILVISVFKLFVVDEDQLRLRNREISDHLIQDFHDDLDSALKIYKTAIGTETGQNENLKNIIDTLFNDKGVDFILQPEGFKNLPLPINEILLVNSSGYLSRAITSTPFSELIKFDLRNRKYFKNIITKENSWYLPKDSVYYYLESIKSFNTGRSEVAISFNLSPGNEKQIKNPVFAITSRLPSLFQQVVPKDIRFLIIDQSGEVLFHSVTNKILNENFIRESVSDQELNGSLKYRIAQTTKIDYNEKKWIARITPVKDAPLYFITLTDLSYTQNKNARTFLFTFYFLLFTFICIVIGWSILKWKSGKRKFYSLTPWSLKWLFYRQKNVKRYRLLLITTILIIGFQFAGFIFIEAPIVMLVYQLSFIVITACAAVATLKLETSMLSLVFEKKFISFFLLILVFVLLIIFLMFIQFNWTSLIPVFSYILIAVLIQFFAKDYEEKQINRYNHYYTFMFLWLMCISAVPAIMFYFNIKTQEEKLWQRDQMRYLALQSLEKSVPAGDTTFPGDFKRITDPPINCAKQIKDPGNLDDRSWYTADNLYHSMPDPVTGDDYARALLWDSSYYNTWYFKEDTLYYCPVGKNEGLVFKAGKEYSSLPLGRWLLYFSLPLILLFFLARYVVIYLIDNLLYMKANKWVTPEQPEWKPVLTGKLASRIFTITTDADSLYQDIDKIINQENDPQFAGKSIVRKDGSELFDLWFGLKDQQFDENKILFIDFSEELLLSYENQKNIINELEGLSQKVNGILIVCFPFEVDYLIEWLDQYKLEHNTTDHLAEEISDLKGKWRLLFQHFIKLRETYVTENTKNQLLQYEPELLRLYGAGELEDKDKQLISKQQILEYKFYRIWSNLSSMEKLVVFDLADDGLVNLKNVNVINALKMKGLLELKPYPKLFSPDFVYFVKHSTKTLEIKSIEKQILQKGKWRNMRYLLLLLLIPLAVFMFTIQGISIEKVVAIFTGVLALFSGFMRLLDSGTTKVNQN